MKTNYIASGLLLLVFSACGLAETPTGLRGTVTDPSGAVIPGARIMIRYHDLCRDQNESIPDRSVTANQAGEFAVNLQSGIYDVVVMANAFEPIAETVRILPGEQLVFTRRLGISSYANLRCDGKVQSSPIVPATSGVPDQTPDEFPSEGPVQATTSEVPDQIPVTSRKKKK